MLRKIIRIDEEKCNGCGLCASACHEGAIDIIDGKAKLVREHFCDGLGDCLPNCPEGAISFEEREAPAYDEAAVKESQRKKAGSGEAQQEQQIRPAHGGCPGSKAMRLDRNTEMQAEHDKHGGCPSSKAMQLERKAEPLAACSAQAAAETPCARPVSELGQWPCQIKLVPVQAEFFQGAKLLIAADCTAYAYANMHEDFMKGKISLIGCPKLDEGDYSEKLTEIIASNDIKSLTIVRMEVPCCGGLQRAAENALKNSGKFIPWQLVTIARDGRILDM